MMQYHSFSNKPKVFIVGSLSNRIADFADDVVSKHSNTLFLCVGNLCVGQGNRQYQDMELDYLEDICRSHDNVVCCIRGSKDNPLYFNLGSRLKYMKGLDDYLRHVHFIDDYDIVSTSKGDFLCVGGGLDTSMPVGVIPQYPLETLEDGTLGWTWFKGSEVKMIDLDPKIETIENEDGEKEEIDTNGFNNWLKMSKVTMILAHKVPMDIFADVIPESADIIPERMESVEESLFLSKLNLDCKNLGLNIKSWYWSLNDEYQYQLAKVKEKEVAGETFISMSSYNLLEEFDVREIL